jgi:uroporphyrinogen-III synthase
MRRLLVLRPEPGASATVKRAKTRILNAIATPLFEVEPVDWHAPEAAGFDGLLLTSANAVRHGGEGLRAFRGLKAYCVGEASAAAARDAGFDVASIGDIGVERLLRSLEADLKLLHLAGEDRKETADARQEITSVTVYRSRVIDDVELDVANGSVALVHSARAGRRFAEVMRESDADRSSIAIAAISRDAADAAGDGWEAIEVAEAPTDEALLALAVRLCNNKPGA